MSMALLDPGVITSVQSDFLQHLASGFSIVSSYALNLLYIFAGLELVVLGLFWALQHNAGWERLFFKIIKIGLIFTVIKNYPDLVNAIISSFASIATVSLNNSNVSALIFNPAQLWHYGYNVGLHLLQSATVSSGLGLALVLVLLGMGILLVLALLGIQIVLQVVGFYLVAMVSLILLPFGAFEPSRKMFDQAVQALLQAGVRVMTVMLIIGIASLVWDRFDLSEMAKATVSINQPLGLLFSALLFLFLSIYLPRFAAKAVGGISSFITATSTFIGEKNTLAVAATTSTVNDLSNMQAATSQDATAIAAAGWQGITATGMISAVADISGKNGLADNKVALIGENNNFVARQLLSSASLLHQGEVAVSKNFSLSTLKKLKEALAKIE